MSPLQPSIDLLIGRACHEETDKYNLGVVVLKAAERVDKKKALKFFNEHVIYADIDCGDYYVHPTAYLLAIKHLLEALPDKEK